MINTQHLFYLRYIFKSFVYYFLWNFFYASLGFTNLTFEGDYLSSKLIGICVFYFYKLIFANFIKSQSSSESSISFSAVSCLGFFFKADFNG